LWNKNGEQVPVVEDSGRLFENIGGLVELLVSV